METIGEMNHADQWQIRLCEHCQKVDFNRIMYEYYPTDVSSLHHDAPLFQFGTIDEVNTRASHCKFCDIVSKAYNAKYVQRGPETQWWLCSEPRYVGFLESRRELRVLVAKLKMIQFYNGGRSTINHHQFELLPTQRQLADSSGPQDIAGEQQTSASQKWPLVRKLSASADLSLIQRWRDLCHTRHGDTCDLPAWLDTEEGLTGLRLLDVQEMCIVQIDTSPPPYAVLSYVWGASDLEHICTTQSTNLSKRTRSKSLMNVHLPETIKDAIYLLPKIGLRYLWVDALCIVQDDSADKAVQVAQMDVIAARSELTIIAASNASRSQGLANLYTRKPLQDRVTVQVADDLQFTCPPSPSYVHSFNNSDTESSPWLRYASSLQQCLNSRRALIFTENEISWECLQDFWCEGIVLEPPDPRAREDTPVRAQRISRRFQPQTLHSLMYRYSGLRVSPNQNESSYVQILASILRRFTYTTGETFHWGLPCSRFTSALTWVCSTIPNIKMSPHGYAVPDPNPEQRRRVLCPSRATSGSITQINIPSWSWLGWLGFFLGFYDGIKEQVYHEPRWYKIGLNGEMVPVKMASDDGTDSLTAAPWHESQNGLPRDFTSPLSSANFVDSGKIGAWVSTARLRVSDKFVNIPNHFEGPHGRVWCVWCASWDVRTLNEEHSCEKRNDNDAHLLHKETLHWSAGPERSRSGSNDGGEADYDFVAVAHDNRCTMCFQHSGEPADKVRPHVHLLWIKWLGEVGREQAERKGGVLS